MIGKERRFARLVACGAHVPERILTNAELAEMVDTSDEWIVARTGIRERRIAAPGEATSDLAGAAAEKILARAGVATSDVGAVLVGTCTQDSVFPSTASVVCDRLGITAGSYDLVNACSSWVYALAQGCGMVEAGIVDNVLVLGAETLSRITDYGDRSTCILFGDAAGGALLTATDREEDGSFLAFDLGTNPDFESLVLTPEGFIAMDGREVFRWASRTIVESIDRLLAQAGVALADIDIFVPHQANLRIIDHAVARTGIDPARVVVNIDRYGNTSSGSVPLALAEAVEDGRVRSGGLVLAVGFGAGLAWAGTVFRYWGA